MCFNKTVVTIRDYWIVYFRNFNLVPSTTEYDVTHKDLIFKRRSETAWLHAFLNCPLNCTSDARDRFELCACKLSGLEVSIKHAFDESSVFVYFERFADQFELLHDFELSVDFDDYACSTDAEVSLV